MRQNKYIMYMLVLTLAFWSCEDQLEIVPTHQLSATTALETIEDLDAALISVYTGVRAGAYYTRNYSEIPDIMADDLAEIAESLTNFSAQTNWNYVSNDTEVGNAWDRPFTTINRANIVISNIENVDEVVPGSKNRILGQALALRALAHFDLLRYYGQSYDRNSGALGIPIKIESNLERPARNTVKEVYDQIFADLTAAQGMLASTDVPINSISSKSRIDLNGVNAIRARVSLYASQWQDAIDYASLVIDGDLKLAERNVFPSVWTQDNAAEEVIWSIAYTGSADGRIASNVYFVPNDRVGFVPSQVFLNLFSDPAADIRYGAYVTDQRPNRIGQVVAGKYLGRNGANDGVNNFKALRMGEMYLIRAEAYARNGQEGLALSDLNALRVSRINGYTDVTLVGSALLNAILDERRKELFLEGHRWFDLRRTGQAIERGADCLPPATACSLPANSPKWVWPIPEGEMNANPNMVQNPGY